jgi:hypothetical protein
MPPILNKRLYCAADAEPDKFFAQDDSDKTSAFALNLSCEVAADPDNNGDYSDPEKDEAQRFFKDFLNAATGAASPLKFMLVSTNADPAGGGVKWTPEALPPQQIVSAAAFGSPDVVMQWLRDGELFSRNRANPDGASSDKGFMAQRAYWFVKETLADEAGKEAGIGEDDIGAAHELRSAHSWNAPAAHSFGLTRAARGIDLQKARYLCILPYIGDNPPETDILSNPIPHMDPSKDLLEFTYAMGDPLTSATCRANPLLPFDASGLSLVDASGYLKLEKDGGNQANDRFRQLLKMFEERATTLTSPMTALARIGAAAFGASDDDAAKAVGQTEWDVAKIWRLFAPTWTQVNDHYEATDPAAGWLAVTALRAALDPIFVALLRPGDSALNAYQRPSGELLATLVSRMSDAIDTLNEKRPTAPPIFLENYKIAESVRLFLRAGVLCATAPPAKDLVRALRHVHQLAPTNDASKSPRTLLEVLLKQYEGVVPENPPTKDQFRAIQAPPYKPPPDKTPEPQPTGFAYNIMADDATSARSLYDESAFEGAIVRVFEAATTSINVAGADLAAAVGEALGAELSKQLGLPVDPNGDLATAIKAAWRGFVADLGQKVDGLAATRHSADADYLSSLLPVAAARGGTRADAALAKMKTGMDFAANLFGPSGAGCFDKILGVNPRPAPPANIKPDDPELKKLFDASLRDALLDIENLVGGDQRFLPDAVPQPLPVQIVDDMSASTSEAFAHAFNGAAIAMRRIEKNPTPFAHLHLSELTWSRIDNIVHRPDFAPDADVPFALHPYMPAATDGRAPLFVEYEGFPFASTAFRQTIPFGDPDSGPARRSPLYKYDAAVLSPPGGARPSKDFAPAPQLAYGREFEYCAFVLSNSGSMPASARDDDAPWLPKWNIDGTAEPVKSALARLRYQRRTAVGRVTLDDQQNGQARANGPAIGVAIDGVHPLANDYPRLTLSAERTIAPGVVDLMRMSDGGGALELTGDGASVVLSEIDGLGAKGRLRIMLHGKAEDLSGDSAASPGNLFVETPVFGGDAPWPANLRITAAAKTGGDGRTTFDLKIFGDDPDKPLNESYPVLPAAPGNPPRFWWLRLILIAQANALVALSFAEPEPVLGASPGVRDAPLLLLPGRDGRSVWTRPDSSVTVKLSAPRTGYLDFERWFANADLRSDAFGGPDDDAVKRLFRRLLTAYVVRHADTIGANGEDEQRLSHAIANLPDPSVAGLRCTLTLADRLGKAPLPAQLNRFVDFSKWPKDLAPIDDWTVAKLVTLLTALENRFTSNVKIQAGDVLAISTSGDIVVTVPPGVVAYLDVAPLVPKRHFEDAKPEAGGFPSVFDRRMLQYAVDCDGDFVVFPATTLRIETMTDRTSVDYLRDADRAETDLPAFVAAMTAIAPAGSARRYDVVTATAVEPDQDPEKTPALRSAWRINGEIETTTQRWRPMGRLLEGFPAPRKLHNNVKLNYARFGLDKKVLQDGATSAVQIADDDSKSSGLPTFEHELFFDRINLDSQTVLPHKLAPLPARTALLNVAFDGPAATYLRHRFALRSRYDAAKASPKVLAAWRDRSRAPKGASATEARFGEWTLRVAALADMSWLTVTRPQARGLLPLTSAVSDGEPAPVMVIFQEPPFGRGGLAERLSAELGLGFGYTLDTSEPSPIKEIYVSDSRKEIGRDPRLTYSPFDKQEAYGMALRVEGPLGLTFDDPTAPSPAFPNSVALLTPGSLAGKLSAKLEENFLGVAMRRWLDPEWAVVPASTAPLAGDGSTLDPELTWLVKLPAPTDAEMKVKVTSKSEDGPIEDPWLSIAKSVDSTMEVRVATVMLHPAPVDQETVVARYSPDKVDVLYLLHQPVAAGRYTTSVLAIPKAKSGDQQRGQAGNSPSPAAIPLSLVTFEWSPRRFALKASQPVSGGRLALRPGVPGGPDWIPARAMASALTPLAWTRTGRDHGQWRAFKSDDAGNVETIQAPAGSLKPFLSGARTLRISKDFWLCSSTFAEPRMPVHVHRRLAVILTGYAQGRGRPVEVFVASALLDGGEATFAKAFSPQPTLCRLVEFETPAMVLSNWDATVPLTYQSAYCDLKSLGFGGADAATGEFFFRFVGARDHLRKLTSLRVVLRRPTSQDGTPIFSGELAPASPWSDGVWPVALRLRFAGEHLPGEFLLSDGSLVAVKILPGTLNPPSLLQPREAVVQLNDGCVLQIKAIGAGGDLPEFWTDVSALFPSAAGLVHPPFEWLFSRNTSETHNPKLLVRSPELASMTEAQARIIAISQPLAIAAT